MFEAFYTETAVFCGIPKPHNDGTGTFVDVEHLSDLLVALLDIFLVDADGVYPKLLNITVRSERKQGRVQVLCDWEKKVVAKNFVFRLRSAPAVRQRIVDRAVWSSLRCMRYLDGLEPTI